MNAEEYAALNPLRKAIVDGIMDSMDDNLKIDDMELAADRIETNIAANKDILIADYCYIQELRLHIANEIMNNLDLPHPDDWPPGSSPFSNR